MWPIAYLIHVILCFHSITDNNSGHTNYISTLRRMVSSGITYIGHEAGEQYNILLGRVLFWLEASKGCEP